MAAKSTEHAKCHQFLYKIRKAKESRVFLAFFSVAGVRAARARGRVRKMSGE
jgi:hypothetical protein